MKRYFFVIILSWYTAITLAQDDQTLILSLDDVISMAQSHSPKVLEAEATFLKEYWQKRTYTATFLPVVSIGPIVSKYDHSLQPNFENNNFYQKNSLQSGIGLNIAQNVPLTGGSFTAYSNLNAARDLSDTVTVTNFNTNLYLFSYKQPLNFFNSFKWQRKIAPLKWEQSKRQYIQAREQLSIDAVAKFFGVVTAQISFNTSELNYANADTLYKLSLGRYKVGTIIESDLLQMELNFLLSKNAITLAKLDLISKKAALRTFLGMPANTEFELTPPFSYPVLTLDYTRMLEITKQNNPELLALEMKLIEADKALALAKANRVLNASLDISFGKNSFSNSISRLSSKPSTISGLAFSINIPIIDYGLKKGAHRIAQLDARMIKQQVDQELSALDQKVLNTVSQFNIQDNQLRLSSKLDTIAQKRFYISKQRFLKGRIDMLDLNKAITDKDNVRNQYFNTLLGYWTMYYQIRQLTLYDFIQDKPIEPDFNKLLKNNR